MYFSFKSLGLILIPLVTTSCAEPEQNEPTYNEDQVLGTAHIQDMFAGSDFEGVIRAVRVKEKLELANFRDHILATRSYHEFGDAVGASVQLDKITPTLQHQDEVVLLKAKTLLLEGELSEAQVTLMGRDFPEKHVHQAAMLRADIAFLTKDFTTALREYLKAAEADKQSFKPHLGRAQVYLKIDGHQFEALQAARNAAALDQKNTIAQYTLAVALKQNGEIELAKKHLHTALNLYSENVPALLELVSIFLHENEIDTAEQYLDKVYSLQPSNNTARFYSAMLAALNGDDIEARRHLEQLIISNVDNVQISRLLGHVSYRLRDYYVAEKRLKRVIDSAPFDRASRIILAEIHLLQDSPDSALTVLEPILSPDDPRSYVVFAMAGLAAQQIEDRLKAIQYTQTAIGLALEAATTSPDQSDFKTSIAHLRRRLVTLFRETGDFDLAEAELKELLKDDTTEPKNLLMLVNLYIGEGKIEAAHKTAEKLVIKHPESPIGPNALGTVLFKKGELEAAATAFSAAILIDNKYASALKNRASVYIKQQAFNRAVSDLESGLALNPNDTDVQLMYAQTMIELGEYETAIIYLRNLETLTPSSGLVFLHHARALAASRRHKEALSKIQQAIELTSDYPRDFIIYIKELKEAYLANSE